MLNRPERLRLNPHEARQHVKARRSAVRTALWPAALAFARQLSLRYQSGAASLPRLAQVLASLRPSLIEQHQRFSINLSTRLSFNQQCVETVLRDRKRMQGEGDEDDGRRNRTLPVEHLVPRLFARSEREEPGPTPGVQLAQRVVARPAQTQAEAQGPAPKEARWNGSPAPMIERNGSARPQGLGAAPLDVKRLTNEVIQVIDRRIMAERERLGRI